VTLFALLWRNIGFSMAASLVNLASTFAVVKLVGPIIYADFTVDIYKLALIVVVLEVVPGPYAIFQSQRDPALGSHLASFAIASSVFCVAAWAAITGLGLFARVSPWMALYAFYLGVQRYLDIRLQATNRVGEFYRLLTYAGVIRLLLLGIGLGLTHLSDIDVLWGSLAIGSLLPILAWLIVKPDEIRPFLRSGHFESLGVLFGNRREYYGYYVNTVLKRLRDSLMPIAASFVMTDRVELARYLLAMRGLEAGMGQLRVVEALLANLVNRAHIAATRQRQLLLLAFLTQVATFGLSMLLTAQLGLSWDLVLLSLAASLFVFPYVFELAYRSDAYAAHLPSRVTGSLLAFTVTLAISLICLNWFGLLAAVSLVLTHVAAQTVATLSYKFDLGSMMRRVRGFGEST